MQESVCKCSSLRKRERLYKLNFSNFIPVFLVAIVPYSLVRDFETILIMKFTQSKLFNNIRLMPNKMLVSWILTSIIFRSIKTPQTKKKASQTKPKNIDSKFRSNYFRQLVYDATWLQRVDLYLNFVSWQIVSKGINIFARFHADEIYSVNSLLQLIRE